MSIAIITALALAIAGVGDEISRRFGGWSIKE